MDSLDKNSTTDGLTFQEAARLQEIEGNPLSSDDIAMFAMFEREAWPSERRIAHIVALAKARAMVPAAE